LTFMPCPGKREEKEGKKTITQQIVGEISVGE
jgi:hypothetical protein